MVDAKVGLEGWLSWELVNQDGSISQEGHQHNMILDQGLNQVAIYGFSGLASYAVVGTGSVAPAFTDVALGSEQARTSSDGGVSDVLTSLVAGTYSYKYTREFTEAQVANKNLTEWGFSPVSATGNTLAVRELFRDNSSNPIVLTPDGTQKLRLVYTLELSLTPTVFTASSINITGMGTINGEHCLIGGAREDLTFINGLAKGLGMTLATNVSGMLGNNTVASTLTYSNSASSSGVIASSTPGGYTSGTYTRSVSFNLATTEGNGTSTLLALNTSTRTYSGSGSGLIIGWVFRMTGGSTIVKDNLHTLTLNGLSVSWGRI